MKLRTYLREHCFKARRFFQKNFFPNYNGNGASKAVIPLSSFLLPFSAFPAGPELTEKQLV